MSDNTDPSAISLWSDKGVIISLVSLVLMLIVLFILPPVKQYFDAFLEQYPEQCKFRVIVKEGTTVAKPTDFQYSADSGSTWRKENEFTVESKGVFTIAVNTAKKKKAAFRYQFSNPFTFNPLCKKKEVDPCDCKQLKIESVESTLLGKKQVLIAHASLRQCPKEFSFSGEDGNYQSDSIFVVDKGKEFSIFVRSKKCDPVAYAKNPFKIVATPAPAKPAAKASGNPSAGELTAMIRKIISDGKAGKVIDFIEQYFDSPAVKVKLSDNSQQTIKDFLENRLGRSGKTIRVTSVNYNNFSKISQISISEN